MRNSTFEAMPLDDLWNLHQEISARLALKIEAQKKELERRLGELAGRAIAQQRRAYPKVLPKFRNPEDTSETWSGRGRSPRWILKMLAAGISMNDLRIAGTD